METWTGRIITLIGSCVLLGAAVFVALYSASTISAAVVPHHDIVAPQRAQFFRQLVQQMHGRKPDTIILVSPNHYLAGQGKIQTTDKQWNLPDATIQPNTNVIKGIVDAGLAANEPASFDNEHGIYNILADIHNNFPAAKLVPIILEDPSQQTLQKLNDNLVNSCKHCLLIASVDFSHYQPQVLAELHDQKSIRDLQALNTDDVIKNAEVDSGQSLALMTMWAKSHNTFGFELRNHTDSDALLNTPDGQGTSHVFGWYSGKAPAKPDNFVSFVISPRSKVGDENRSIWGTDINLQADSSWPDQDKLIAGEITPTETKLFLLPFDQTDVTKLKPAKTLEIKGRFDLQSLTNQDIKSIIKSLIQQSNGQ